MENTSRIRVYAANVQFAIVAVLSLLLVMANGCRTAPASHGTHASGVTNTPGKGKLAAHTEVKAISASNTDTVGHEEGLRSVREAAARSNAIALAKQEEALHAAREAESMSNILALAEQEELLRASREAASRSNALANAAKQEEALHAAVKSLSDRDTNSAAKRESPLVPAQAGFASYTNVIQEGDIISIAFDFSTNFNTVTKISLDGMCNLRGIAPVKAVGKTPQQLQTELTELYKPQVKGEPLSVSILSTTASIYVSGAVLRSGKIPLERPMTVLEGIMEAGGFDPNRAKMSEVTVIRMENGRMQTYHVNVKRMIEGKNPDPFYLKPFDVLHVPTKTFNF